MDQKKIPHRVYISASEGKQIPALILLRIRGLKPGEKIFWKVDFKPGPQNKSKKSLDLHFKKSKNSPFNRDELSSEADEAGEASVLFTTTTYAGDRFQFSADRKADQERSNQYKKADFKSHPVAVWKKIYFEAPKVLKNVKFPGETMVEVKSQLAELHIQLEKASPPLYFDPAAPEIGQFFTTHPDDPARGKGKDPRYGPISNQGKIVNIMLSKIAALYDDGNPNTINLIILGSLSPKSDLLMDTSAGKPALLQPVDYSHSYQKDEIDLSEVSIHGMGMQMDGNAPVLFIWSDFWWVVSQVLGVPHEKSLSRVILHELGHHILNRITINTDDILDETGHIDENHILNKSIMTGLNSLQDSEGRNKEKRFIQNPVWHPRIEHLIRKYYAAEIELTKN